MKIMLFIENLDLIIGFSLNKFEYLLRCYVMLYPANSLFKHLIKLYIFSFVHNFVIKLWLYIKEL
ncbi:hypothetical protein HLPR_09280 [Helicovermis profundi]|uniref:Uncharacterized protein n=1 Tax=Helicovermis profundi TaxID=3065157 RepID=A0AAU9E7G8_9FIRM|nr:hypothetical protein HLPR_09280 [Clostridia bacterium S502]